jgi:hypothetical protein
MVNHIAYCVLRKEKSSIRNTQYIIFFRKDKEKARMATAAVSKAGRRQSIAKYNRWLGWLSIILVIAAYSTDAMRDSDPNSVPAWLDITMQSLVGLVPLIHAGLSMYLFGFPRFASNVNVAHIYIGYAVLLAILISQSLIGQGTIYAIMTWAMYILIAVHVVLGTRSWLQRRNSQDNMAKLHRAARSGQ